MTTSNCMQNYARMLKMIPERLYGGTAVIRIRLFVSACSPHLDELSLQPPNGGLLLLLYLSLQARGQHSILGQTTSMMNSRSKNSFVTKCNNPYHYNYFSESARKSLQDSFT